MSISNDEIEHYAGMLLEDMDSKLDAILEAHTALVTVPSRLANLETSVEEIKLNMKAIKTAVKHESSAHKKVQRRVQRLETAIIH